METPNQDLIDYFSALDTPEGPIRINAWTVIVDPAKFIESHLAMLRENRKGRPTENGRERLEELKKIIATNLCNTT